MVSAYKMVKVYADNGSQKNSDSAFLKTTFPANSLLEISVRK
jgi:hypothetical protein